MISSTVGGSAGCGNPCSAARTAPTAGLSDATAVGTGTRRAAAALLLCLRTVVAPRFRFGESPSRPAPCCAAGRCRTAPSSSPRCVGTRSSTASGVLLDFGDRRDPGRNGMSEVPAKVPAGVVRPSEPRSSRLAIRRDSCAAGDAIVIGLAPPLGSWHPATPRRVWSPETPASWQPRHRWRQSSADN